MPPSPGYYPLEVREISTPASLRRSNAASTSFAAKLICSRSGWQGASPGNQTMMRPRSFFPITTEPTSVRAPTISKPSFPYDSAPCPGICDTNH